MNKPSVESNLRCGVIQKLWLIAGGAGQKKLVDTVLKIKYSGKAGRHTECDLGCLKGSS